MPCQVGSSENSKDKLSAIQPLSPDSGNSQEKPSAWQKTMKPVLNSKVMRPGVVRSPPSTTLASLPYPGYVEDGEESRRRRIGESQPQLVPDDFIVGKCKAEELGGFACRGLGGHASRE
ncbi:uncharacterized protein UV8b_05192 [Ustilaginoidea virens]|uniref:Uncharacterized protein n=1 Tax=Ustilaginoidea virens TaxID=1159556 RepID=A0A063BLN4_USTVR|nr:uncharacterized protein UV8b_05192 [Ustilaginoidea virens]QUC20951.1 hypothetical protein UV8b_05192 [Ustilaginoidea virens]GAO19303.1 hypothetical protein UVI_02008380 [Ustilaginoidea virens]